MKAQPKPHRPSFTEGVHGVQTRVDALSKGDCFVRHGALCMVVEPPQAVAEASGFHHVWIVSLASGGCWPVPEADMVHPAFSVRMSFDTTRRET